MAKFSAQQIKEMLLPVAQFAPAVMAAGEIIAAAETAEKEVIALVTKKTQLNAEIEELNKSKANYQDLTSQAGKIYHQQSEELEKKKTDLQNSMQPLLAEREKIKADIAALAAEKETMIADMNAKRAELKAQHEKMVAAFEDFRKIHRL